MSFGGHQVRTTYPSRWGSCSFHSNSSALELRSVERHGQTKERRLLIPVVVAFRPRVTGTAGRLHRLAEWKAKDSGVMSGSIPRFDSAAFRSYGLLCFSHWRSPGRKRNQALHHRPRPRRSSGRCSSHGSLLGVVVSLARRYMPVLDWYSGGISVACHCTSPRYTMSSQKSVRTLKG